MQPHSSRSSNREVACSEQRSTPKDGGGGVAAYPRDAAQRHHRSGATAGHDDAHLHNADDSDRYGDDGRGGTVVQPPPPKRTWLETRRWPVFAHRREFREYLAEFWGIFMLMFFGGSACSMLKFNAGPQGKFADYQTNVSYLAVTIGWGFGLTIGLYVSMGISGGHLNPAVTFANAVFGNFPWRKVPGYWAAQLLGSMTGCACMYGLYKEHFDRWQANLAPGETMTSTVGGIFCTYSKVSHGYAVWSELINTAVLLMAIFGLTDDRMTPAVNHKPLALGILVWLIGLAPGWNTAYAINPARDMGPRLISAFLWGSEPFTFDNYYFVIPLFVPMVGALLGTFLYVFFIIPNDKDEKDD